jgi:hypothetical protein
MFFKDTICGKQPVQFMRPNGGTGSTAFPGCGAAVVLGPLTAPGRQGPLFHLPLPLCPWVLGYNRDKTTE